MLLQDLWKRYYLEHILFMRVKTPAVFYSHVSLTVSFTHSLWYFDFQAV